MQEGQDPKRDAVQEANLLEALVSADPGSEPQRKKEREEEEVPANG